MINNHKISIPIINSGATSLLSFFDRLSDLVLRVQTNSGEVSFFVIVGLFLQQRKALRPSRAYNLKLV